MIPYQNNEEIVTFFHKAQNKIAQLGSLMANEDEDEFSENLLIDLSDLLESLDSPYNTWEEVDIIRYIHFWNKRADLNNVPYIQITNYQVNINDGGNGNQLEDVEGLIRQVLSTFPHNSLFNTQGCSLNEKYHLSKSQLDWLVCQMGKTPCPDIIQPTVELNKLSNGVLWPSGFYELGTAVTVTKLTGSIQLNSGSFILYYAYKKDNAELAKTMNPSPISPISVYSDRSSVKTDTTYSFEANFAVGGLKSDSKSILFRQPLYFGILKRNLVSATTAKTLVKDVRNSGYIELNFQLPSGNTLVTDGTDFTPTFFYPASWGIPTSVKVLDFDFKSDWTFTLTTMQLADGSNQPAYLAVYNKNFEGNNTFKFSF